MGGGQRRGKHGGKHGGKPGGKDRGKPGSQRHPKRGGECWLEAGLFLQNLDDTVQHILWNGH